MSRAWTRPTHDGVRAGCAAAGAGGGAVPGGAVAASRAAVEVREDLRLLGVHGGVAEVEVEIPEGTRGEGPPPQPEPSAPHDMTQQGRRETGRPAEIGEVALALNKGKAWCLSYGTSWMGVWVGKVAPDF